MGTSTKLGLRAAGVLGLVGAWWFAAMLYANPAILPSPGAVLTNALENFKDFSTLSFIGLSDASLVTNLSYTVEHALLGWIIGSVAGVALGLTASRSQAIRNLMTPVFFIFGAAPVLVTAPFFLIWFGFSAYGQLALVAFYCFVILGISAQGAGLGIPPQYEEYGASLGLGRRVRMLDIVVPASLPAILGGLRVALGGIWEMQAIAELLGSDQGIGRMIIMFMQLGDVTGMLVVIIALGLVAVIVDRIVVVAIRHLTRWQDT